MSQLGRAPHSCSTSPPPAVHNQHSEHCARVVPLHAGGLGAWGHQQPQHHAGPDQRRAPVRLWPVQTSLITRGTITCRQHSPARPDGLCGPHQLHPHTRQPCVCGSRGAARRCVLLSSEDVWMHQPWQVSGSGSCHCRTGIQLHSMTCCKGTALTPERLCSMATRCPAQGS